MIKMQLLQSSIVKWLPDASTQAQLRRLSRICAMKALRLHLNVSKRWNETQTCPWDWPWRCYERPLVSTTQAVSEWKLMSVLAWLRLKSSTSAFSKFSYKARRSKVRSTPMRQDTLTSPAWPTTWMLTSRELIGQRIFVWAPWHMLCSRQGTITIGLVITCDYGLMNSRRPRMTFECTLMSRQRKLSTSRVSMCVIVPSPCRVLENILLPS